jgi:hypothetical protein
MADGTRTTNSSRAPKRTSSKSPVEIVESVRRVLDDLGGLDVESVTGVEADDDGWRVSVEVVEVRRVPDTADVLAKYEVSMSKSGQFRGYRQVGHRLRSQIEEMQ